ncbi:MAG: class II aldolase/adducin family protein [Nanoarchaeota archaeon]
MENYGGAKFRTVFLSNSVPIIDKSKELISWFRKFYDAGLAPQYGSGSSGNLSFRHKKGLIIKSTKTYFNTIKADELVYVEKFDFAEKTAYVHGKLEPSTELQMHYLIYQNRKDINAVFHVHDYGIMKFAKKFGIPVTDVTEAGTEKIGYDALKKLDDKKFVMMKGHGVVAVGKNIEEAGKIILKYHRIALES